MHLKLKLPYCAICDLRFEYDCDRFTHTDYFNYQTLANLKNNNLLSSETINDKNCCFHEKYITVVYVYVIQMA